jgi:hypothetical protein
MPHSVRTSLGTLLCLLRTANLIEDHPTVSLEPMHSPPPSSPRPSHQRRPCSKRTTAKVECTLAAARLTIRTHGRIVHEACSIKEAYRGHCRRPMGLHTCACAHCDSADALESEKSARARACVRAYLRAYFRAGGVHVCVSKLMCIC